MPEEIMVASWRVITVSSAALTRFGPSESSMLRPDFFSRRSMIVRPCVRSCSITAPRLAPTSSPADGVPAPSSALYAQVEAAIRLRPPAG
jgi:hypothetical protein